MSKETVGQVVVAVVTAAASGVVALMQDWFHGRDRDTRRKADLAEAGQLVQFLDSWLHGQESVSSPERLEQHKATVREQLETIYAKWLSIQQAPPPVVPRFSLANIFLLYRPRRRAEWIAQLSLWVFTVFAAMSVTGMLGDVFTNKATDDVPTMVAGVAGLVTIFGLLRAWARRLRSTPRTSTGVTVSANDSSPGGVSLEPTGTG